jgi:hypothetical protein
MLQQRRNVMSRTARKAARHPARPAHPLEELAAPVDDESSRVVARPDGFYWVADDGHQEFGPYNTAMDALVALRSGIDTGLEPDETLAEAEDEIGFVEPTAPENREPEE